MCLKGRKGARKDACNLCTGLPCKAYYNPGGKIYIYLFESLYLQKTIDITAHDKKLICMGLEGSDNIIYPGEELGSISIVKLSSDEKHTINAHSSAIENLCISNDGKYCASASERGTIIRMFSLETRECINEFRRGSDPTTIINIRFNSFHICIPNLPNPSNKSTSKPTKSFKQAA